MAVFKSKARLLYTNTALNDDIYPFDIFKLNKSHVFVYVNNIRKFDQTDYDWIDSDQKIQFRSASIPDAGSTIEMVRVTTPAPVPPPPPPPPGPPPPPPPPPPTATNTELLLIAEETMEGFAYMNGRGQPLQPTAPEGSTSLLLNELGQPVI